MIMSKIQEIKKLFKKKIIQKKNYFEKIFFICTYIVVYIIKDYIYGNSY